jgi:hypothetical protein
MGLKSKLKRGLTEFIRVWGFAFPKTALILQDAQGSKIIWENFKISSSISKADVQKYTEAAEALEVKVKDKKAGKGSQKNGLKDKEKLKKKDLDLEDYVTETELGELKTSLTVDQGISLVTNTKTQDIILVSGQADTFFRSTKPANVYPNLTLSVFLPLLIITELWQLAIINNWPIVDWQAALIGSVGITLALHNARYAFMSSISALYCTKKIYLAATPIYIPNLINFLALKQSKPADLKSDTIAALAAELRPLRFRVQTLMISLEEALLGLDQAKAIGERKGLTLGGHKLAGMPSYVVIIGVLILGIIIGYFLANGLSFTPSPGG